MKIAQIKNSKTGAFFLGDSYKFGEPSNRKYGKQCGGSTNDWLGLTGKDKMGNTPASKVDGYDFVKVNEGEPITGGYFVMSLGQYYHVGVIRKVEYKNGEVVGIHITDMNRYNDENRRDIYIEKESKEWNYIVGFGVGNPVIEMNKNILIEETIIPVISAMWMALDILEQTNKIKKAKVFLEKVNKLLRNV